MILDSGFCVLQGVIDLRKLVGGVQVFYLKMRYWTTLVSYDAIDDPISNKDVGNTDNFKGNLDNHHFKTYLKEPDFLIKIISISLGFTEYPNQKVYMRSLENVSGEANTSKFNYNISFINNFKYNHTVYGHNNPSHSNHPWRKLGSLNSTQIDYSTFFYPFQR